MSRDRQKWFAVYVEALAVVIGAADRAAPLRDYCLGLLLPGERQSVAPIAALTAPARVSARYHSLRRLDTNAPRLDRRVLGRLQELNLPVIERSGAIKTWIIDDTLCIAAYACRIAKRARLSPSAAGSAARWRVHRPSCGLAARLALACDAIFGEHYVPHDGDRESLWLEGGTRAVTHGLNFYPRIVERPRVKGEAIEAARAAFAKCQFDETGCAVGLQRLRAYRKSGTTRGVWRDRPQHDEASHAADVFMTFACSGYQPPEMFKVPKRDFSWVV